jgi:hypothetical protein
MYDPLDGGQGEVPSRIVAGWIQASRAGCRMLVEEPALATAITVAWSLEGACEEERTQAAALAQRLGEEYCLRATVTAHDSHFSVRFVRSQGSGGLTQVPTDGARSAGHELGDVRPSHSGRPADSWRS